MATEHGDFVWYELMTTDADAAQDFYGGLLGWTFEKVGSNGTDYRAFSAGSGEIGGFLQLSAEMQAGGAMPAWLGYIHVDSLDKALGDWNEAGGTVAMGPMEVPGVGPFAMVADRQGAMFYLIEDRSGVEATAFSRHEPQPGHCAWNELMTADPDDALSFYGEAFGWSVADTMDMGPMGEYRMMKNGSERDFVFGAMMKKPDGMPVSAWAYYFRVPEMNAAIAYLAEKGAQVINGPMEIPGGDYALAGIDPQGAVFNLVGVKKD